jgi:uncharacterized damage-inducible protein DinB
MVMEKFFEEYLVVLEKCHGNILGAVEGLSGPALDWQPGTEMNSIAVLIYHLSGAERFWIGDVVDQTPSGRDREAEFKVQNIGLEVLQRRLDESLDYVRSVVGKLSLANLPETRLTPDGRTFSVAWVLLHIMEHSSLHLGHIEMTRQMWQAAQVSD